MTSPMPPSIDRESPAFKAACAAFSKSEWASEEPRLQAAIEAYLSAAKAPLTEAQEKIIILQDLIRVQGWGNTTEYNFEYFDEDIFPLLGLSSFADIGRRATEIRRARLAEKKAGKPTPPGETHGR